MNRQTGVPDFDLQVMFAGIWPQFNFFDMNSALDAFLMEFFTLLIFEFAIIHEPANRRVCVW